MPLPRFVRTTSFRLTLLYAALFFTSVLLLFAAMYWYGTGFIADQIDTTVSDEITEVRTHAGAGGLAPLQATVAAYARQAPSGMYYLLEDGSGKVLAGNMPGLPLVIGVRNWPPREEGGQFPIGVQSVRGRGVGVDNGAYLFVGVDATQLDEMREMIARAFLWGLLGTILLSLAGGTVMSLGLLRHVEAVSQTSRDIIAGDLSQRLPVRGSNDEFDHLAVSLNAMLERIEKLMAGLREVSSDIAHDLRTPLSRLRQRLERARHRSLTVDELHNALDHSIEDVDAILDTFAALLRIAQIEAHAKSSDFTPIDLTALLDDMVETFQSVAEEHGQLIRAQVSPGLTLSGDRELLPQLLANLVENAIRHCPKASIIRVTARDIANGVEVTIADSGPGIPAELREKVFQRFYRLERSRTTEGTGLGLSLAAAIARLHGATIELLDNAPGLKVRLMFPLPYQSV